MRSTWSATLGIPQKVNTIASLDVATEPAVTVVEITDPAAAGAGNELLDVDAMQLELMPLRARRVIVQLESAAVIYHSTNLRVSTRTWVVAGRLAYVVFGPHTDGTVNGLPIRPGVMLLAAPESEVRIVTNAGYEGIAFLLPPEDIRAHLAARERALDFRLPAPRPWLSPRDEADPTLIHQDLSLVQQTMWNYAGIVRSPRRLTRARRILLELREEIQSFYRDCRVTRELVELRNAVQTALLVVHAASLNPRSRGAHFLVDE